jgi:hypothetical protein
VTPGIALMSRGCPNRRHRRRSAYFTAFPFSSFRTHNRFGFSAASVSVQRQRFAHLRRQYFSRRGGA